MQSSLHNLPYICIEIHTNQQLLFEQLKNERKSFIERICKARPANMRFRKGWLNRLADFRFVCVLLLLVVSFSWGGCKSTSQLELSANTQQESTGNKVYNQHEEVLSEIQRENSTQTSWEEIVVITSDSLPVAFTALLNKPASFAKGIYILKKKQLVATNHHQKQAIEIQTKSAIVETSAKREENINATSSVKSSPKNRKLILFLIAFILLLIFFIAYKITPFFRK